MENSDTDTDSDSGSEFVTTAHDWFSEENSPETIKKSQKKDKSQQSQRHTLRTLHETSTSGSVILAAVRQSLLLNPENIKTPQ